MKSRSLGPFGPGLAGSFSPCSTSLKGSILILNLKSGCESLSLIQTRACVPTLVELWYCLKFCKQTQHCRPAGPCCHDNPNYLPLRTSFDTGRGSLCSLGICISLGQVLRVRKIKKNEMTRGMNTTTNANSCMCEKRWHTSTHLILWQEQRVLNIS